MNILHESLKPKKRDLFLTGVVSDSSVSDLGKSILEINRHDAEVKNVLDGSGLAYTPPPINLFIDSPGGHVASGLGLISIVEASNTPVHTICTGQAASMGALLLMSGHRRHCFPRSQVMIHQLSSGSIGQYQDMLERVEYLTRLQTSIEDLITSKTKITRARLKDIRERKLDLYLSADEAIKLKVVDAIITSI